MMTMTTTNCEGMAITQLISMLMAAQAQGATHAMIAIRDDQGHGRATGVDWVSPEPVEGVLYIGCMPEWEVMGHTAMESLDW